MNKQIEPIREKLDEKIKQLNSSRVFKKVTPKYDLSWYVKWVASVMILIAVVLVGGDAEMTVQRACPILLSGSRLLAEVSRVYAAGCSALLTNRGIGR